MGRFIKPKAVSYCPLDAAFLFTKTMNYTNTIYIVLTTHGEVDSSYMNEQDAIDHCKALNDMIVDENPFTVTQTTLFQ